VARVRLIAISGSTGLIGKTFIEKLSADIKIIHTVNSSKVKIHGIEKEIEYASQKGAEYFLNLGWPASSYGASYQNSLQNFDALEKTLAFRRACEIFHIDFIGVGSVVDKTPLPKNLYSLTKYVAREIFSDAIETRKITWLRPYYVFNLATWPYYLHNTENEKVIINNDAPRDFIHVNDVAEAIESVIRLGIKGEIDLGSQLLKRPSEICEIMKKEYCVSHNNSVENSFLISKKNITLSQVWKPKNTLQFFNE